MFKITCRVGQQEHSFYLEKVSLDQVEQVANVLANNLSFDDKNTQPTVLSIVKIDTAGTPLFEYCGSETISIDIEKELGHRKDLQQQGFFTGAIHNIKEKTTELFRFKVIKE